MLTKWKLSLLLILILLGNSVLQAENHPIYIILTHPRATATAFEKIFRTRENMQVLHAPFLYPYLIKKYGSDHKLTRSLPDHSVTFESVIRQLYELAEKSPVFLKESGYLLLDYLKEHPEFYMNPQIKMAILVRDPAKSIISYYKKMPTVNNAIIGHRQLWELFVLLEEKQGKAPMVIDSDEFLKGPIAILNHLGKEWGLQFDESNLKWEKGYAEDWHLKDWYVEVGESTELGEYRGDIPREADGTPIYAEVTDEKDRQRLQEFYRSQNVYYQKLLQHALKGA